jgi:hypothetical protein
MISKLVGMAKELEKLQPKKCPSSQRTIKEAFQFYYDSIWSQ